MVFLSGFGFFVAVPVPVAQYIDSEWTVGVGEPANAILSARSDPDILIDQETNGGLRNYFLYVLTSHHSFLNLGSPRPVPCFFLCGLLTSLCFAGRSNSERSVWVNMRVRIKFSIWGMATVPVSTASSTNPLRLTSPSVLGNETAVIRYNYGDPSLGTCQETIQGGNHFRYWVQNGPQRNSSAVFMAFSYEHTLQGTCFPWSISLGNISIYC